ncbi:MAG: LPS export ABC transporter periplasmic protein LptC [Tropicimonas sp.]|uniref:LPS export ABC transporter periplasmic protein LptC n=1 Tax=Tropicimonas sp. TaxID=2067044 RepID=UPI003A89E2E3
MQFRDNLHSRIVRWLKILLPLAAIGLLSAIFLVATRPGPAGSIAFSPGDLAKMASGRTVEGPVFSSVTDDGKRIVVTAETATPRGSGFEVVDAVNVHGTLYEQSGETIEIRSQAGVFYSTESRTILTGDVRVDTSSGYRLRTQELISSIDRIEAEAPGPVFGEGPLGTIEAGRMQITSEQGTDNAADKTRVVFKGGVKVIYTP